jgi:UDP-glucose 4-epimerase
VKRSQLDASRAASVLGWAPKVKLDEGVARTVEYFRNV